MPKKDNIPKPLGDQSPNSGQPGWPPQLKNSLIFYLLFMAGMLWIWQEAAHQMVAHTIPYSEFKTLLAEHKVRDVTVGQTEITGKALLGTNQLQALATNQQATVSNRLTTTNQAASTNSETTFFRTVRVDDPNLVADLQKSGVEFTGVQTGPMSQLLWAWLIPIAVMIILWRLLARRMGAIGQGLMSFGSSKARLVPETNTPVTFNDVAGCDEAKFELQEVVDFLKDPLRYKALGATIPRGILLIGPPGTGKTLLARAVAGEAKVPFFLISGSDFVEMFVGVGAARVRDLFQKAKAQAPCIVFIDELDAVGRQRGVHMGPVNDEREQTLNQLLVGLDGFEPNAGVIVLAATNRPEVLDRALLRPGRFDRQIVVDAPDVEGRFAILKLHAREKVLAAEVDLRKIAAQTPGFSGADLANLLNEAALLAARRHAHQITQQDLEEAVEKVVAGPERKSRRLSNEEKTRVAYHEVGHALVAVNSRYADPVHKISIVPRGHAALGYTMQVPEGDRYLMNRSALLDRIKGQLGGRAAEEVIFNDVSTGAENDLQHATSLARQMVAMFGMSEVIGLAHCARRDGMFDSTPGGGIVQRDCSEQTAREIDVEVKRILSQAYTEARAILEAHRNQLEIVAAKLLEHESLDARTFQRLLEETPALRSSPAQNGHSA